MNRPYSEATRDMIAEATEQHHIVDGQTTGRPFARWSAAGAWVEVDAVRLAEGDNKESDLGSVSVEETTQ